MTANASGEATLVRFWGTRGVLPIAAKAHDIRGKIANALVAARGTSIASHEDALKFIDDELDFAAAATYGGATSCVEIECGDDAFFICDMGSGFHEFGRDALRLCRRGRAGKFNIFLSHTHSDHIMGFPSFLPLLDGGAEIVIHACHPNAEAALRSQQDRMFSSFPFDAIAARVRFVALEPGREIEVDGLSVIAMRQDHPGDSFGYRFTDRDGRSIVYSTDCEHRIDEMTQEDSFARFFEHADLVICDTMYSLAASNAMHEDRGHSSNVVAIDLCRQAGAKRLALFHHDPMHGDEELQRMHEDSLRYEKLTRDGPALEVLCAYDGLEVPL